MTVLLPTKKQSCRNCAYLSSKAGWCIAWEIVLTQYKSCYRWQYRYGRRQVDLFDKPRNKV